MKIKIFFFLFVSGILIGNAYCVPVISQAERDKIINQELDLAEGYIPVQPAKEWKKYQEPSTSTAIFNDRVHTLSIAYQAFYNHTNRPVNLAQAPTNTYNSSRKDNGFWQGSDVKYTFRPTQESLFNTPLFNYYAIQSIYAAGKNNVKQDVQSGINLSQFENKTIKNIPGYMFDNRILLGRDIIVLPNLRATPYTGFGVRDKTDQSAGHVDSFSDGTTVLGWNFSDLYYYIPIGLTLDLVANKDYEVSLNMEYDYLVKGYERDDYSGFDSYSQPIGFDNQNVKYTLHHGYGERYSLKLLKHYPTMDVYLEPYIRYWSISPSKVSTGTVGAPNQLYTTSMNKNTTLELGSSLGVQF